MALELTLDYRLRWNDFDRYSRITPASALDIFQDMAIQQAEVMGIGRDDMMAQDVFWVIVRMKYEVIQEPQLSMVKVRTWPHTPTRFSFLRDFTMHDEDGTLLVKASSEWVLVNAHTREFERVTEHYHGSMDFFEDRAFESKPKKVPPLRELGEPLLEVHPAYTDIDVNGHVNNARYPVFVMDALRLGPEQSIRTFQIDYRYEVAPDDVLKIYAREDEETGTITAAGVLEDGTVAFNVKLELA